MKIAVIGGSFLGCATTLDLALVQEHDEQHLRAPNDDKIEITLFEKTNRLAGNDFKSVPVEDDARVEVGTYRTLPLSKGTFLSDLVATANDHNGTIGLFGRRFPIPGATVARRGKANAATVLHPWSHGTYGKVIRTFAAWNWEDDAYHLIHTGWPILDIIHRVLNHNIWRSLAFAALLYSVNALQQTVGRMPRAMALAQCVTMLALFLLSPRRIVAYWQQHYSFWGTTIPLLFKHGITPAISRGSSMGFLKQISDINQKNAATCAISIGTLLHRTGLEPYMLGTGDDYVRQFKYERPFVQRYMEPIVSWAYRGARLSQVSSLASHFAMLDGDFANSDAWERLSQIGPENATLCTALIEAAKTTVDVDVKLENPVRAIVYDDITRKYEITYGNGEKAVFDGIALCASPKEGEMMIETPVGALLSELLGYDRDVEAKEAHAEQEAEYQAEQESTVEELSEGPVLESACNHFAVVIGTAKPTFFRFSTEKGIPDLVQMTHAPGVSRFERIREVSRDKRGIYTVLCGPNFKSSGLFSEMFEEGAEIIHFEELTSGEYSHNALPRSLDVDACMPNVVLGNRFVYVAATRKLARHPEMDAISAVNSASLFSRAVQWSTGEEKDNAAEETEGTG